MDPLSSSSGDAFDSMGFNDFMNAQGSSDEEHTVSRLPGRRNAGVWSNAKHGDMYAGPPAAAAKNPYSSYGSAAPADPYSFASGGGVGGDPYSFNIDFSAIKAPPKKLPESKPKEPAKSAIKQGKEPIPKKEVSFENPDSLSSILSSKPKSWEEEKGKTQSETSKSPTPAKSQFADMMHDMMKEVNALKEEEEDSSNASKDDAFLASNDSYEEVQTGPSQKVVNWSDIKEKVLNKEDLQEIEDSIRDSQEKPVEQPISLVRKFTEERKVTVTSGSEASESFQEAEESESNPSPGPIIKSEPFRIPGAKPVVQIEEVKAETTFVEKPQAKIETVAVPYIEPAKTKEDPILIKEIKSTEVSRQPIRPELLQPQPRPDLLSFSPAVSLTVKPALSLSRESSTAIFGRAPFPKSLDLQNQLSDYSQRLVQFQDQLEAKQQRIFELEKERLQSAFSKLEGDALEKTKTALREANHKLELYHIEIEELIKQVDFTEARVKDLEAENAGLKKTVEAKNKLLDDRTRTGETRAEERTLRESNRLLSLEKEQWDSKLSAYEKDLSYYKDLSLRLEKETAELRVRLQRFHDQSSEVDELKRQLYLLDVQLKETQQPGQPSLGLPVTLADLSNEENRLKFLREFRLQEQLINGYQKENERLVQEMKQLKENLANEQRRMYAENKKMESLKTTLIKEHGGMLIKEGISDLSGINELAGGTVVSKEEFAQLRERAARLDRELQSRTQVFVQKEAELHDELDRLRRFKQDSECRLAGAPSLSALSDMDAVRKEFESKLESISKAHEAEVAELTAKVKWYIENQELIDRKTQELQSQEQEINSLKERLGSKGAMKDNPRVKELEKANKILENQLREKDPNSVAALIRAAKPTSEENELIKSLQLRIEELTREVADKEGEYESKFRGLKQEYDNFRLKTEGRNKPKKMKVTDSVTELRIKELEKQVDDTKAYYVKRLKETGSKGPRADNPDSGLNSVLAQKEKLIENLQAQLSVQKDAVQTPGLFFNFLSSAIGLLWTQIIQHVSILRNAVEHKNVREVADSLDHLLTTLDTGTNGHSFPQFQAVSQITDRCMDMSNIITNPEVSWAQLQEIYRSMSQLVDEELWRQMSPMRSNLSISSPAPTFQDQNFEAEALEERLALAGYEEIQPHASRLTGFQSGLISPSAALVSLTSKLPKIDASKLRPFIRLLLTSDGAMNLEETASDLRGKNSSWWRQKLREKAFALRTHTRGSSLSPALEKWLVESAIQKLLSHVTDSQTQLDDLISKIFESLSTISLGGLRSKLLDQGVPLTQEDTKAVFSAMDKDRDGLITRTDLIQALRPKPRVAWTEESERTPVPVVQRGNEGDKLTAANARIQELETLLRQRDSQPTNTSSEGPLSVKINAMEEDLSRQKGKFERLKEENERLKLDKDRLESHIQRTPAAPGTADFIALQRKIELIEESHFRREQNIRTQLDVLSLNKEQEMLQMKKRHEEEVQALQRLVANKSLEIEEFKTELEAILKEMEALKGR